MKTIFMRDEHLRTARAVQLRGGTDPLFDPFLLPHFRPSREQEFCVQAA